MYVILMMRCKYLVGVFWMLGIKWIIGGCVLLLVWDKYLDVLC